MPRAFHTPVCPHTRPKTKAIEDRLKAVADSMPFDLEEYIEFDSPGSRQGWRLGEIGLQYFLI